VRQGTQKRALVIGGVSGFSRLDLANARIRVTLVEVPGWAVAWLQLDKTFHHGLLDMILAQRRMPVGIR
jgi:hypothetical protein